MLSEELKSIDELIMLKHFLETEEKYEGQEREVKAIETVLNLINKLQKEIKEQKHKKTYARQNIIYKSKQLGQLRKNMKKLQKENEVKDKQIKDLQSRKDNQEKRFKKYKENIDKQYEEMYENLEKISQDLDNVAIDQIPIAIAELKYKNQVTEKQIDLMAEYIDKEELTEIFCNGKIICERNCKDCIKQYFETKVKKGE